MTQHIAQHMAQQKRNGFTLVELAIALMVIGLLIGGVLKGQELIENAKVTAFMRQIKAYDTATMIFRNTYGALPGDIKKPSRIPNCNVDTCRLAGNGDGKIESSSSLTPNMLEHGNFFPHLTKAGMIQGPEGGNATELATTWADTQSAEADLFFPQTNLDLVVVPLYYLSPNGLQSGNYYRLYWPDTASSPSVNAMIAIDTKMDDGKPFRGDIGVIEAGDCPLSGDLADPDATEYDTAYPNETECNFVLRTGW